MDTRNIQEYIFLWKDPSNKKLIKKIKRKLNVTFLCKLRLLRHKMFLTNIFASSFGEFYFLSISSCFVYFFEIYCIWKDFYLFFKGSID